MKKMKRFLALVVAMTLIFAMNTTVFAATLTINSGSTGNQADLTEYTYYEVFKADIGQAGTVDQATGATTAAGRVAYYIPASSSALKAAVAGTGLFNLTLSADSTRWIVELKSSSTSAEDIASALDIETVKNNALITGTFSQTAAGGSAIKDGLDDGYYLIKSSLGTKLAVQTIGTVTINEKNTYPSIPGGKTDNIEDNTVSIGQTITYTIPVQIPASVAEKAIYVYDTITDGLTINTAITVTGSGSDDASLNSLTWVVNENYKGENGDKQYIATIPAEKVLANKGKTLTLTYTATVNSNAVVLEAESNKAYLKYDNFTGVETETTVVPHAFTLKKIDGANVTSDMTDDEKFALDALAGAEFTLWTAEKGGNQIFVTKSKTGEYRVDVSATSGVNIQAGEATIEGLAAGTYYLQEEVAPAGYNKLTTRTAITVSASTSANGVDVVIENNAGTTLPSTGGIGTTIFYVIGAILVIGAGILLVTRRRMSSK